MLNVHCLIIQKQGMSVEECNELEQQEIAEEEEEERKGRKNILLDLEHHFEQVNTTQWSQKWKQVITALESKWKKVSTTLWSQSGNS